MSSPERGEVWLADLGFAAKVRPVLVVSVPFADADYALIQVVPHTTQRRGTRFEVDLPLMFLGAGVFNVQGMLAVPAAKFLRRLGTGNGRRCKMGTNHSRFASPPGPVGAR